MSDIDQARNCHSDGKRSVAPWLTILTALGIGAAAFVIAKRFLPENDFADVDDLIGLCERAAAALDQRSAQFSMAG